MTLPIGHSQLQSHYQNANNGHDVGKPKSEVAAQTHGAQSQVKKDPRTVEKITAGPLFNNLHYILNPEELKAFKAHTGDWDDHSLPLDEQKANALNAEAALRLIDGLGGDHSTAGNNKIDGEQRIIPMLINPQSEYFSLKGSEARLVLAFARGGYPVLIDAVNDAAQKKNAYLEPKPAVSEEANMPKPAVSEEANVPTPAVRGETDMSNPPSREEKRPAGDQRSAVDIFYDNPMLNSGFMAQIMTFKTEDYYALNIRNGLIEQVGDFTADNRDPISRAEAMYRLAHVAQSINNDPGLKRDEDNPRESGRLSGFDADPRSEMGTMIRFSKYGYRVLTES
ncbi:MULTISPECIES: hypothetical protein [Pseudomonas fluorescens group]|uniref:Uncharacterized protein n=1 Tax=Pseudomonas fluorescens TaxID=294 RepID=A0A0D0SQQ6_PSEFL|nr:MULTISPECIES: hypothetical protein [Pseudomonas fluorescens group]AZE61859.1 hypothetical protein C4K02_3500 [Pseudomonas synxantha]KIR24083.1 hypothetical protein PFLU3_03130 [Pseudomonas fluorescens]